MTTIKKQFSAVLLSTHKESKIFKQDNILGYVTKFEKRKEDNLVVYKNLKQNTSSSTYQSRGDFQHLYILSDKEVKEGIDNLHNKSHKFGWYIRTDSKGNKSIFNYQGGGYYGADYQKIIATTDFSLKVIESKNHESLEDVYSLNKKSLPKPTDEFIQQWIAKGCPEKIEVEYEGVTGYDDENQPMTSKGNIFTGNQLLVSSDNTINCSFIEDDWDSIIQNFVNSTGEFTIFLDERLEPWLKENYNPPIKKL